MARSHSPASWRWWAAMFSWSSHGWLAPLQTWMNRTPRSSSRRVIRSCRAWVPGPYSARIDSGSRLMSNASAASPCIR